MPIRTRSGLLHQLPWLLVFLKLLRIQAWTTSSCTNTCTSSSSNSKYQQVYSHKYHYRAAFTMTGRPRHDIVSVVQGKQEADDDGGGMDDFGPEDEDNVSGKSPQRRAVSKRTASTMTSSWLPPPLDPLPNAPPPPLLKTVQTNQPLSSESEATSSKSSTGKTTTKMHPSKTVLHAPTSSPRTKTATSSPQRGRTTSNNNNNSSSRTPSRSSVSGDTSKSPSPPKRYASMLPPPLPVTAGGSKNDQDRNNDEEEAKETTTDYYLDGYGIADMMMAATPNTTPDASSGGLSSWEQFLGTTNAPTAGTDNININRNNNNKEANNNMIMAKLPSIQDLFPPDLSLGLAVKEQSSVNDNVAALFPKKKTSPSPSPAADGIEQTASQETKQQQQQQNKKSPFGNVLPVSDLFYRSSSQTTTTNGTETNLDSAAAGNKDSTTTRRTTTTSSTTSSSTTSNKKRRMVRRGMEMLVGGVPVNADPPQRVMELSYNPLLPWHSVIKVHTGDFGPFLDASHQELTRTELGLYCEFFVYHALKWNVCPDDLRAMVETYLIEKDEEGGRPTTTTTTRAGGEEEASLPPVTLETNQPQISESTSNERKEKEPVASPVSDRGQEDVLLGGDVTYDSIKALSDVGLDDDADDDGWDDKKKKPKLTSPPVATKGFGKPSPGKTKTQGKNPARKANPLRDALRTEDVLINMESSLSCYMEISVEELAAEGIVDGSADTILRDVLSSGIRVCVEEELQRMNEQSQKRDYQFILHEFQVEPLVMEEQEDGRTSIYAAYKQFINPSGISTTYKREEVFQRAARQLQQLSLSEGALTVAWAAAIKKETRWSKQFRERIYEEFLFQEDDEDRGVWGKEEDMDEIGTTAETHTETSEQVSDEAADGSDEEVADGEKTEPGAQRNNQFSPGLPNWDYSEKNARHAPYGGNIGSRLLEVVEARTKETPPKLIVVGDVHGCVDELQDLLRQCHYYPGDLVVLLGDLVSKGPDSISAVKMARAIGAIGVRGE